LLKQSLYDLSYFRRHKRDKAKAYGLSRKEYREKLLIPKDVQMPPYLILSDTKQKQKIKD
jgi:predicted transcriptional regulator